jgi:cytochrome c-type biogenesis protein CcmH/NrfF
MCVDVVVVVVVVVVVGIWERERMRRMDTWGGRGEEEKRRADADGRGRTKPSIHRPTDRPRDDDHPRLSHLLIIILSSHTPPIQTQTQTLWVCVSSPFLLLVVLYQSINQSINQ